MYDRVTIEQIHQRLVRLYPRDLVLLGGSCLYDEVREGSDVDFYIICPLWHFVNHVRRREEVLQLKQAYPLITIMFMPGVLYKHGWYYIYGQDINGYFHSSVINKKVIFRNALKLAYYHYLSFLFDDVQTERRKRLIKSAQQAAAAISMLKTTYLAQPLFAISNLKKQLEGVLFKDKEVLLQILEGKLQNTQWNDATMTELGARLQQIINHTYTESRASHFHFSFVDYLVYNLRFLMKKDARFLTKNPNKHILESIYRCLTSESCDRKALAEGLKEIVFPIFVA